MRLHLRLTPNTKPIPFNYQHKLTGTLHKWLGQNDLHDKISLYSFSWLRGDVDMVNNGLNFPNGANWFIKSWNNEVVQKLKEGLKNNPSMAFGMKVYKQSTKPTPNFGSVFRFEVDSPVLTRMNRDDNSRKHLTFEDEKADSSLTRTLRSKLREAGFSNGDREVIVGFDRSYQNAHTKLIEIKDGIKLKTSICPVIVAGTPKAVQFAWNVGVGEMTGSGFGCLK
ncbi:CRISPR-associated endoribonuclease Cas6 [Fodinibius sediminis]|uniref:CRISPR-associated protein, Cas6 family n=1 Tax=Fodinibius sediminis TaxID=1214077 RepID=A0A521DTZ2_9BACT|nr:CRISPR-associated endoribonuclease Cas6 [Fodinibius sediminis]SMO75042.1 CRISPR-associated protein, Cas6 family [Fodinibius sediminis]